jgi:hypothetical protein
MMMMSHQLNLSGEFRNEAMAPAIKRFQSLIQKQNIQGLIAALTTIIGREVATAVLGDDLRQSLWELALIEEDADDIPLSTPTERRHRHKQQLHLLELLVDVLPQDLKCHVATGAIYGEALTPVHVVLARGEDSVPTSIVRNMIYQAKELAHYRLQVVPEQVPVDEAGANGYGGTTLEHRSLEDDEHQTFLLHWAATYAAHGEILRLIWSLHHEAIHVQDAQGKLPLHLWLSSEPTGNEIRFELGFYFLLGRFPDAVQVADGYGCLPLHYAACHQDCPAKLLQVLYEAYPKGIRQMTLSHDTALSFCVAASDEGQSIHQDAHKFLLLWKAYPRAALRRLNARLPIQNLSTLRRCRALIKAISQEDVATGFLTTQDPQGNTLAHLVCHLSCNTNIHDDETEIGTNTNSTTPMVPPPMSDECDCFSFVFRSLVKLVPDLAFMPNLEGELPLHTLLKHGYQYRYDPSQSQSASTALSNNQYFNVAFLMDRFPQLAVAQDPKSHLLPFMLTISTQGVNTCNAHCVALTFGLLKMFLRVNGGTMNEFVPLEQRQQLAFQNDHTLSNGRNCADMSFESYIPTSAVWVCHAV